MIKSGKIEHHSIQNFNDGLLDIFVGLGIFFASLFLWTGMVWMAAILIPIFLPSFQEARKKFLNSRIRIMDQIDQQQEISLNLLFSFSMLLGLLVFGVVGLFLLFDYESILKISWFRQYIFILLGLIFTIMWFFGGLILNVRRFHVYAVLSFISMLAAQIAILPFWSTLAILGGMISLIGVLVLICFLLQYPE